MSQNRLRIFAGPNGSGKSSLLKIIPDSVPLGFYINADEIEKLITTGKSIKLQDFGITTDNETLQRFFKNSGFVQKKSDVSELLNTFLIKDNFLKPAQSNIPPKYSAAIISEFIREENLKAGNDFSFETVMSHENKIDFIRRANSQGYHVYLYFICTDDVRVNVQRVRTRVKEGGHPVPEVKIRERYSRSLNLLYDALKVCYKSYLFDNSDNALEIARIDRDKSLQISVDKEAIPNWIKVYVLAKLVEKS